MSLTSSETTVLTYDESATILSRYGIPLAKGRVATSRDDAVNVARSVGYPVALKAISKQVSHKTEANAIKLGVKSDGELLQAFDEVTGNLKKYDPKAEVVGVLVQEMLGGGTEVIVGTTRDP